MQKNVSYTYQLSLADVKEAIEQYMETKLYRNNIGDVYSVACVDGKGSKFSSKEAK